MAMFDTLAKAMTSPGHTLNIQCRACDHRAVWSRREAFDRLGPGSGPYICGRKLICKTCGERNRISVWV